MNEFKDFESFNPKIKDKKSKLNKSLALIFILSIPFLIRFVFYNIIYDLPLSWFIFGIGLLLFTLVFSEQTFNGRQIIFYGYKGFYTKYLILFLLPIIVTSFVEDLKLSHKAISINPRYISHGIANNPSQVSSFEITYNALNVVNKIGGYLIYIAQIPVVSFFTKIEAVKIYQGCLIKKLEGDFSDDEKEKFYYTYYDQYERTQKGKLYGIGYVIQKSYLSRVIESISHLFPKVFLFNSFDKCR